MAGASFLTIYNVLFLGRALLATLVLSFAGALAGLAVGFPLSLARRTKHPAALPFRLAAILYIGLFRRVPFLVTLFIVFFASQALHADLPLFVVALVSVALIATAYLAEIIRAGLDSVPETQREAAAVMNFSSWQSLRHVVLPQAWRVILPPAFGFFLLFIKDSALASQIGVVELTFAGKVLSDRGFPATLVYGTILLLYFAASYPLARLGARLEKRLAPSRHR
jgi:polar amino acid transport system permease protein